METGQFIIAPVWSEVGETDKTIIRIEPSMAFGTGTHETTRLCLREIEETYQPEMSFFDVGTGTGILAIAAAKIKSGVGSREWRVGENRTSSSISACDTDEDSVRIARENAELNGAGGGEIEFYVGSIDEKTPQFDFVCANLTADVIVPLLPLLVEKTGSVLLLSGILREQEEWVAEILRELRIADYELRTDGEWISMKVRNS